MGICLVEKLKRWVLLRHTVVSDDPVGDHFDLLLEDRHACRTWRLTRFPRVGGSGEQVTPLQLHSLKWLEKEAAELSEGRGSVKRVLDGIYQGSLEALEDACVRVYLRSKGFCATLEIKNNLCFLTQALPIEKN